MQTLYSKNFLILAFTMLMAASAFMLLMPVLPIFAMEVVKLPEGKVGLIVGVFSVSALLARPFIGYMLDNFNRKALFVTAMAMFTCVVISYEFVSVLTALLVVRMLHGLGWASVTTAASTIVVDIIPPNRRAEGIGMFSLAMPIAMVIGPAAGMQIYQITENFKAVFTIAIVLSVAALILAFFLNLPKNNLPKKKLVLSLPALYETRVLGVSFMQFCYSFAYSGIATFLPTYAIRNNIPHASYFFFVYAISVLFSRVLVRKMFDLRGPSRLIYAGYIFFASGAIVLGFSTSTEMLYLSGFLAGMGGGMVMPTINTMTMNIVERAARGKANATVMTAIDVGMGAGALILGFVAQHMSYRVMYISVSVMLIIPILWYILREKKRYLYNLDKVRAEVESMEGGNACQ